MISWWSYCKPRPFRICSFEEGFQLRFARLDECQNFRLKITFRGYLSKGYSFHSITLTYWAERGLVVSRWIWNRLGRTNQVTVRLGWWSALLIFQLNKAQSGEGNESLPIRLHHVPFRNLRLVARCRARLGYIRMSCWNRNSRLTVGPWLYNHWLRQRLGHRSRNKWARWCYRSHCNRWQRSTIMITVTTVNINVGSWSRRIGFNTSGSDRRGQRRGWRVEIASGSGKVNGQRRTGLDSSCLRMRWNAVCGGRATHHKAIQFIHGEAGFFQRFNHLTHSTGKMQFIIYVRIKFVNK